MNPAHISRDGAAHGSLKSYGTGFLLAVILTTIPFWLVMSKAASPPVLLAVVFALGAVQVIVHLRYFLHVDGSAEGRWNLIALFLAVVIVAIVIVGSLWVIWELNARMMPQMMAHHHHPERCAARDDVRLANPETANKGSPRDGC